MKIAECQLESATPFSPSRYHNIPKLDGENSPAYEERTWRDRCHTNEHDQLIIPPMMFANSIKVAAQFLSIPIPGKLRQTYTKHFDSGVMVTDGIALPIIKSEVKGEWYFVPSDGVRGGGKRVAKCFPVVPHWSGTILYIVTDDVITEDAFRKALEASGQLIGIGRFRPRNRGYYGQFKVIKVNWIDK